MAKFTKYRNPNRKRKRSKPMSDAQRALYFETINIAANQRDVRGQNNVTTAFDIMMRS